MASIERTAYPASRQEPNVRELQDSFTPSHEELNETLGTALEAEETDPVGRPEIMG